MSGTELGTVETHAGTAGPTALVAVPLEGHRRPRDRLDPRRPRGRDRRLDRGAADREGQRARAGRPPGADRGIDLRRGRLRGCAVLRPAHGPARAQEAVPRDADPVPGRDGRHRVRGSARYFFFARFFVLCGGPHRTNYASSPTMSAQALPWNHLLRRGGLRCRDGARRVGIISRGCSGKP
jgi:hypothetical protein